MLIIRLFRTGKKNQPFFKIVVTDKRNPPKGGRFVEKVGFWNPLTKERKLNAERIKYWLSKGAQVSDTVHNFLVDEKIVEGQKIVKHSKPKKLKEDKSSSRPSSPKGDSEKQVAEKETEAVKPEGEVQEKPKEEVESEKKVEEKEEPKPEPEENKEQVEQEPKEGKEEKVKVKEEVKSEPQKEKEETKEDASKV